MTSSSSPRLAPRLTAADVEVLDKTTAYDGYFRIDRYRLKHKLFEGGWSGEMTREVFERGHVIALLPYDPDLDRVVLIEQFRVGVLAAQASRWFDDDASPWLIECVAGVIDKNEDPEQVARRETLEETGCELLDLIPLYHFLPTAGGSSESVFLYCGRVDAAGAEGVYGITEEHENIRVFNVPAEDAFRMLDEGRIINSITIITLQWLRLNRDRIRAAWSGAARPA